MKKVAAAKGKRSGADRLHANDLHTNQFPLPVLPAARPFARAGVVGPRLLALIEHTNIAARIAGDPLGLVHRYAEPLDREIVGLLAASVAYGRVGLFLPRLEALFDALGPAPGAAARDLPYKKLLHLCRDFNYRMTGPEEVASLLAGAGQLVREHGSLGQAFTQMYRRAGEPSIRGALGLFVTALTTHDDFPSSRRLKHLLPHPSRGSA